MPRPQTPYSIAEATGAVEHNRGRYEDRKNAPQPDGELGGPPAHFGEVEQALWNEIARSTPPGVLTSADRILVEVTAKLLFKLRYGAHKDDPIKPVEIGHLRACLGSMGLTPADRGRVTGSNVQKEEDPAERFLARRKGTAVN